MTSLIQGKKTKFEEVKLIDLRRFHDDRGFFQELFQLSRYEEVNLGPFVQVNHSFSEKGVIRGMHFQSTPGQGKLLTVISGKIYDVFVDIRKDSPTFGQWDAVTLDSNEPMQLYVPPGFAHGFAALEAAHVMYQVTTLYSAETEKGFCYNDPAIGIDWPVSSPILSEKDAIAPNMQEVL